MAVALLETLFERSEGRRIPLPASLAAQHDGGLVLPTHADRPFVFSNFVSTLDGIVSFGLPAQAHAGLISRGNDADRLLQGLLRACADAVVVGAGTLRIEREHVWTPERAYPSAAADFTALRAAMGMPVHPITIFVTASGAIDLDAPAFRTGERVIVVTGRGGARRLGHTPAHIEVRALASDRPTGREIVASLGEFPRILTEGGPNLLGEFLSDGSLDEMFLTFAPQLAGRTRADPRLALVEGVAFAPEAAPWARLLSLKRSQDDFLFLRFGLQPQSPAGKPLL